MPPRHILAQNLSILGFNPKNYVNSHYSGVVLNDDAFSGANNTKAFELISWFLFNKLDSHKAKKLFAHCWPIVDYRSQPREYRSAAYKWLEELKKENRLVGDIVLRRSYLEDCRGERIEKIMMALSTLVLKTTMERKQEFSDEPMIALNGNVSNVQHLIELEEATLKANKIVAKLEARHRQSKQEWENKERIIKQKLERLDSYQKQVESEQSDGTGIPHYILQMTRSSSSSYMERQMLQRLDTLDALWNQCTDELLSPNKDSLKVNEDSSSLFPLDTFSKMWLESWNTVRRIKSEMAIGNDMEMDNRLVNWAETQAVQYQRRIIKAQAIKSMLQPNHQSTSTYGAAQVQSVYHRKHALDHEMYQALPTLMPSFKRARSSDDRVQDIRNVVRGRVDASYNESRMNGANDPIKPLSHNIAATSELSKLSRTKVPIETFNPSALEVKSIKPKIKYDRNGRRIRPAAEEAAHNTQQDILLDANTPINNHPGSSGVLKSSAPTSDRLFKENRGGKIERGNIAKSDIKDRRSITPGYSLCDEIVDQVNNPPLSMITPPRSYSPKTITSRASNNFESPSYTKFREYKQKLSAVDTNIAEQEHAAMSPIEVARNMSPILPNNLEHDFSIHEGDNSNIFEGFLEIGAQSTPQKPSFKGGLERSTLSIAAASPANNSLLAYNAAIDDTSVYIFGEKLPENFDDGVDLTL